MLKFLQVKQAPAVAAPIVALSVVFGAASGFIGGLLAVDYLYPTGWTEPSSQLIALPSHSSRIGEDVVRPTAPVEAAARAQVLFFRQPAAGQAADSQIYWPAKAVAAGVVLTSDGWLVSHGSWPAAANPAASVAVIGSKSYPVTQVVSDRVSGIIFLKIEAAHLPVIGFDESSWFSPGDPLFALDPAQGPRRLDVIGYGPRPAAEIDGLIVSSESLDKHLRLPSADGILPGSMILDRAGQVVAVFAGNDAVGSSAVPVADFSAQVEPVVRGQAAERPLLGVNYVDLTRLIGGADRLGSQDKGALLVSSADGKRPAVIKGSPAAAAGLRAGDVILAVNQEEVSAKRSLSDIISDYRPGTETTLTVLRGAFTGTANWRSSGRPGGEIELKVTLGKI